MALPRRLRSRPEQPIKVEVEVLVPPPERQSWLNRHSGAIQAIATAVAVVVAVVAGFYAYRATTVAQSTLQDQQQFNADQLELNERARDRLDRRYASRVSWWWPPRLGFIDAQEEPPTPRSVGDDLEVFETLVVQNRAVVPMQGVFFELAPWTMPPSPALQPGQGLELFFFGALPPCQALTVELVVSRGSSARLRQSWAGWGVLSFIEPDGTAWRLDRDGPVQWNLPQEWALPVGVGRAEVRIVSTKDVGDCGESG